MTDDEEELGTDQVPADAMRSTRIIKSDESKKSDESNWDHPFLAF